MKTLIFLVIFTAFLSSCSSSGPAAASPGAATRSIQNTASTVGIVRNIQSILQGF